MKKSKEFAQKLFDKMVVPIMDLPLTDDTIKAIGIELTQITLDKLMEMNTDISKHDFYCEVNKYIHEVEF